MKSRPVGKKSEARARLGELRSGSWASAAGLAKDVVRPTTDFGARLAGRAVVSFEPENLSMKDRNRQTKLKKLLRLHWDRPVTDEEELAIRDSFDEALTYLQLLELAVETGYLGLGTVRREARRELTSLLWSQAARTFVEGYDYLAVRYLAARVEVDLALPAVEPPTPKKAADIRFAAFLGVLEDWYEDPSLDMWLGFLDDYALVDEVYDEREAFEEYLKAGVLPEDAEARRRLETLAAGMDHFIWLAELFDSFDGTERRFYGVFFSYWLAKFFGWERPVAKGRYEHDADLDWSTFAGGPVLVPESEFPTRKLRIGQERALRRRTDTLRMVWDETRELLEASLKAGQ